ncbi:hypothetical protein Q1695_006819 [Nippostrongylus brasiliensis]|nr:hypothetical protein Q1695_006819 [Nippostrongylus brasiliensis]
MEDESRVHRRGARIPDLTAYPLRLEARLEDMSTMAGWSGHRTVGVCITKTNSFLRLEVEHVEQNREAHQLHVTMRTFHWNNGSLCRDAQQRNRKTMIGACIASVLAFPAPEY